MPDNLANFKNRKNKSNSSDIDKRLLELTALFEISQTLNSSLNLQSILNNVLLVPMGRMMLSRGIILIKNHGSKYKVETVKGLPHTLNAKILELPGLPKYAISIGDLPAELIWKSFFQEFNINLLIPFLARTDVIGVMGFGQKLSGQDFTEEEIEFLTSLANIATTSIDNALVFEKIQSVNRQLDHKIQELNTLFEIGKELNLTFEKEKILKLLSYALMGQVTVNSFIISTKENNNFGIAMTNGSVFKKLTDTRFQELCSGSGFISKPYLREEGKDFDDLLSESDIRVVVPMQIQNEIKGYIFLSDKITQSPYSNSDLEFLQTLGNVAIISLENALLFQETLEKKKLEEEMAMARSIQNRLLPKLMPEFPNLILDGINVPSLHVGGDYFDVIPIDNENIVLTIADVSGKGMPASLLMSNLQAGLHALVRESLSPDILVSRINELIYNNTDPEKYITFFYGRLHLPTLKFTFVNAGHNPPYILHKDGSIDELVEGGIILGMMTDVSYEIGGSNLKKGDTLLMYTDGVTETMRDESEEFEEKRLIEFMKRVCHANTPKRINELLIEELNVFAGDTAQGDDITILTLKII